MLGNFGKHWHIGRTIYGKRTWRETRRTFLHAMRSCRHDSTVTEFENFFKSYTADPKLLQKHPSLYELMSRMFLIKKLYTSVALGSPPSAFHHLTRGVYG